jgi:hypothetical protein
MKKADFGERAKMGFFDLQGASGEAGGGGGLGALKEKGRDLSGLLSLEETGDDPRVASVNTKSDQCREPH